VRTGGPTSSRCSDGYHHMAPSFCIHGRQSMVWSSLLSAGWPTSGSHTLNYALWAAAHTSQFVRPGWFYLAHGAGVGYLDFGGTYVAATDGAGNVTIVLEKLSRSASQCLYAASPPNETSPEAAVFFGLGAIPVLHVWKSNFTAPANPNALFQYAGTVSPDSYGSITVTLDVGEVVTLTTLYNRPPWKLL